MLPGHVLPFGVALLLLNHRRSNPVGIGRRDIADLAVFDAIDGLDVLPLRVALCSRHHGQLQLFGFFRGSHEPAYVHGIGTKRLFAKDVFAGFDCSLEMHGPVAWRRAQHHDIDIRRQHFLISVETDEVVLGVNFHFALDSRIVRCSADFAQRFLEMVLENIAHRHQFDVFTAVQKLLCRVGAASAATYQAGAQLLIAGAPNEFRLDDCKSRGRGRDARGPLQERPAR